MDTNSGVFWRLAGGRRSFPLSSMPMSAMVNSGVDERERDGWGVVSVFRRRLVELFCCTDGPGESKSLSESESLEW